MYGGFVCISGIHEQTGLFVRPEINYPERPGIKKEFLFNNDCLIVRPLVRVELDFLRPIPKAGYHTEDWLINGAVKPRLIAIPTDEEKRCILSSHADISLERALADQGRSLVIVQPRGVPEFSIRVYDGKLRTHMTFRDQAGDLHNRLPITDANWLGVVRYLWIYYRKEIMDKLRKALEGKEIYLRIGITREWRGQKWRQISGVFSIPDWLRGRSFADFDYDFMDNV